jgi:myo-inositol-1-phosphate synthase
MSKRRIGLWLVGACGGVGTTVALGLAALARGVQDSTGMVTALPLFDGLDLDAPGDFTLGGHDIRRTSFLTTVAEFQERSNIFPAGLVDPCREQLEAWNANIRPGTVLNTGETIAGLADLPGCQTVGTAWQAIERVQQDLREFQEREKLDQVVVLNVASTEPPFPQTDLLQGLDRLWPALKQKQAVPLPASSLYALAAIDLGLPYVNFTPSLGASFPAALALAQERRTVVAGQDGKTGETLLKSVLAPMFAHRNLNLLSWVGHNIFGNRDGLVLNDPRNKESKIRTKDQLIQQIVGYPPQTHVSIEYIPSLDDWKTAWDHIHFQGFLGVKMIMQFIWQGCDSILAAPLAIDLVRLALHAHRRGEVGVLRHLACFFKNPMGVPEHDFFVQWRMLEEYVAAQAVQK